MKKLIPFFLILFLLPSAMAWYSNESFGRRKAINIDYDGGNATLTNYSFFVNISYDSDMDSKFGDIRFLNEGSTDLLDYYIVRNVSSSHAEAWFKIETGVNNTENYTAYMYYGSGDIHTTGNCDNTFWDCSHFNDLGDGTATNGYDGFSKVGAEDFIGSSVKKYEGSLSINASITGNEHQIFKNFTKRGNEYVFSWHGSSESAWTVQNYVMAGNKGLGDCGQWNGVYKCYKGYPSAGYQETGKNYIEDTEWHRMDKFVNETSWYWYGNITYDNGTSFVVFSILAFRTNESYAGTHPVKFYKYNAESKTRFIDLVYTRAWVGNEPDYPRTIAFGLEEDNTYPTNTTLWINSTQANQTYLTGSAVNLTVTVNVSGTVGVDTNMTSWVKPTGSSPFENITTFSCASNETYNVTGYFEGNATALPSSETRWIVCWVSTTTTIPTIVDLDYCELLYLEKHGEKVSNDNWCKDNQTLMHNVTHRIFKDGNVSYVGVLTHETCVSGCDNTTRTCYPTQPTQYIYFFVIIFFVFIFIFLLTRIR